MARISQAQTTFGRAAFATTYHVPEPGSASFSELYFLSMLVQLLPLTWNWLKRRVSPRVRAMAAAEVGAILALVKSVD